VAGTRRRGFTLVEVVAALTLTAIVITIAAGALASASDAHATIGRHRRTLEAESRWRSAVTDMLRHPPRADAVDEPLVRLSRAPAGAVLTFLSVGVVQPFGTGRIWRVTIAADSAGLQLDAEPIGTGEPAARLHTTLSHIGGFDVAVLERTEAPASWRGDWPIERNRPALLRLSFRGKGEAADPPLLLVKLAPLDGVAAGAGP
jgi:prepilin-type N-terminal cleavage/methylation domain-containing protein